MPYSVGKDARCPDSKPHAVKKDDGSLVPGGCHKTRDEALKHQRALVVNVESDFQRKLEEGARADAPDQQLQETIALAESFAAKPQ
jgi:hypothetical protein